MVLGSGHKPSRDSGPCRKGTESKPALGHSHAVPALHVLPVVPPGLMSAAGEAPQELDLEDRRGEKVSGLKETAGCLGKVRGRKFLVVYLSRRVGKRLVLLLGSRLKSALS